MFGWLSKNALPDADSIDRLFEVYSWLLENTGGFEAFSGQHLVLPTDEFFPIEPGLEGHDLARALFELTREWSGLAGWPCRLVAHSEGPSLRDLLGNVPFTEDERKGAAGTFSVARRRDVELTYAPSSLDDPATFVATMAHELSHYLMATFPSAPPGGEDAVEPVTDVCAVFLGFGVFMCNAAFSFRQFSDGMMQGWSTSRHGYLDEKMLAYALAVFMVLRGAHPGSVARHLKPNPRSYMKHAFRDVNRRYSERIAKLREVRTAGSQPVESDR
jgi:hypothetical protein